MPQMPKPGDVVVFKEGDKRLNAIVLRAHLNQDGADLLHLLMSRPEVSEQLIGTSRGTEAVRMEFDVPPENWEPFSFAASDLCDLGMGTSVQKDEQISTCIASSADDKGEASDGDRQER